jgi:hypothetical protein
MVEVLAKLLVSGLAKVKTLQITVGGLTKKVREGT